MPDAFGVLVPRARFRTLSPWRWPQRPSEFSSFLGEAEFVLPWDATPRPPCRAVWVRMRSELPDDQQVHERVLTYISDWGLLDTSLLPHPMAIAMPEMQMASLSHSVHFHQPFRRAPPSYQPPLRAWPAAALGAPGT